MQAGLRLQILVWLGGLLALAFLPLYFAVSTYTDVALSRERASAAQTLAGVSAGWIARAPEAAPDVLPPAAAASDAVRLVAFGVYTVGGQRMRVAGERAAQSALPEQWAGGAPDPLPASAAGWVWGAAEAAGVRVLVWVDPGLPSGVSLRKLLGFYVALVAGALLVGVYFAVTTFIIRPLDQFALAAQRVASAGQGLQLPAPRSRELRLLGQSLLTMTDRLAQDQSALQRKVVEVERAREQLEQAQAQLVRSERLASVGQLAAGLAHEIGNPIAALQGMQDLILDGDLDAEQQADFMRRMRKETERINRIIRDLLDFARPSRQGEPAQAPGDVPAAVHETATLVSHQPLLRDVQLSLDVYPELPLVALGHAGLTQVLLNLILNAAAACHGEGQVQVVASRIPKGVRLTVSDDGPGVPAAVQERIFEPFFSTKDVGEGSGLGLSVCRGLVEAVGGSIFLDPQVTAGARFVVELPAAESADVRPGGGASSPAART